MNPLNCRIRHALRFGVYHIHWRLGPCTPSITVEKYTPPICFGRTASATRFCRRSSNVQRMMKKLQRRREKELAKTMLDTLIYWGLSENSGEPPKNWWFGTSFSPFAIFSDKVRYQRIDVWRKGKMIISPTKVRDFYQQNTRYRS